MHESHLWPLGPRFEPAVVGEVGTVLSGCYLLRQLRSGTVRQPGTSV